MKTAAVLVLVVSSVGFSFDRAHAHLRVECPTTAPEAGSLDVILTAQFTIAARATLRLPKPTDGCWFIDFDTGESGFQFQNLLGPPGVTNRHPIWRMITTHYEAEVLLSLNEGPNPPYCSITIAPLQIATIPNTACEGLWHRLTDEDRTYLTSVGRHLRNAMRAPDELSAIVELQSLNSFIESRYNPVPPQEPAARQYRYSEFDDRQTIL